MTLRQDIPTDLVNTQLSTATPALFAAVSAATAASIAPASQLWFLAVFLLVYELASAKNKGWV